MSMLAHEHSAMPGMTGTPTVIDSADFGAVPNDGRNNLGALRDAVSAAIKVGNCVLRIAPGRYNLADPLAIALQEKVLSGDFHNAEDHLFNPDYRYVVGLDFSGAEHITVDASGVEFLIDGWMEPVCLQDCCGVTINGLSIDYKRPPNSEGVIIAIGDGTIDVKFADWCPVHEKTPFIRLMIYDETQESLCGESLYHSGVRLVAPQTIRLKLRSRQCEVGRIVSCLHGFHFRPAILLYQARNTVFSDITIHAQPGMGVVGHLSENLTMNRLRVVPAKGRHVSSNTDATHFATCRGVIV